jgi:putative ABC transport system substrate-binding protein
MDRRTVISSITLALLAAPLAVGAQQPVRGELGKIPKMGVLAPGFQPTREERARSVWGSALRDRGLVEGKTIVLEERYAEGQADRLPSLAADLVRMGVDVITADTPPAALAAKNATTKIPIVFLGVIDPVRHGLVDSLARPGGNLTGLTWLPAAEVAAKHLEFLKEIAPTVKRVAWLRPPRDLGAALVPVLPDAARQLGVELRAFEASRPEEYDQVFTAMLAWRAEAVIGGGHPVFLPHRTKIVEFTIKHRLPATFGMPQFVQAGGLLSYGPNYAEYARRWVAIIDKILRGTKPEEIPVEEATRFELFINLKTAKALGLTIPPSLLQRADQVIE